MLLLSAVQLHLVLTRLAADGDVLIRHPESKRNATNHTRSIPCSSDRASRKSLDTIASDQITSQIT
ncbi:hypothetical protein HanIR_Chr05g0240261 [Helianthus annuus]|nr:hypothetical protein HanIR_Chr05g0240261 [Helianthus annuus]